MTGRRDYILASLAVLGQGSIIAVVAAAWNAPPANPEITIGVLTFCQNLVLGIVGYFAGASKPESGS
jgi:hypothetical protein